MNTANPIMPRELDTTTPWYRQFWPWVLILLPASAVVAGLVTLWISMQEPDGLVVDEYYKEGLAINRALARDRAAAALGLAADVQLQAERGTVTVALQGNPGAEGADLHLRLLHPTRANNDVELALQPAGENRYSAPLGALAPGHWHVVLEPAARGWRITGRLQVPEETRTRLAPEQSVD